MTMTSYDIILIHPPAIYDFRRRPLFPGAMGQSVEGIQFNKVPIGMLSIAEYLDRHGYRVIIDNLCDRMINVPGFDVEKHLKSCSARIYAVGLNFQQHSQGAVEIARLCKSLHPNSHVIMGGMTATRFHEEIIEKYPFIDAVVRGEAEKPMLQLVRACEEHDRLTDTPNLTYRNDNGSIRTTPLMPASQDLDEYEYVRFDLLEPKTSICPPDSNSRWSLAVCRGCIYNCAICGGSAYAYKKYFGMKRPAFRSPDRLVADMKKLNDQGIYTIGLYQDPRMAGKKYWQELAAALAREKPNIERLSLDLLAPADEEFVREFSRTGQRIIFHLCPDTGCDEVRRQLGRRYSNDEVIETIKLCHKYHIPVTNFFSVGLAGETEQNVRQTWDLWSRLDELNYEAMMKGCFGGDSDNSPSFGQVLGSIVLDPGSPAFDEPEKYGYKLLYNNLEEYIQGLAQPFWHHWLNYETLFLDRNTIVELILQSVEFTIDQREKYGFYSQAQAYYERCRAEADRVVAREAENIMKLENPRQREIRVINMRRNLDALEKQRMTFLE
ncbi:MAG: radical SAM protein [Desulfobacteraceae bacterium]|nr:radical SAM protein [Desulfobacteraceae bacterium]